MTAVTERSPTMLNQIIAVRASVKGDADAVLTKAYHLLQRPGVLAGLSRTYTPKDDEGFRYPAENGQVLVKAQTVISQVTNELTRLFDVTAAMDWSNQEAKGDVVIMAGEEPFVLLRGVPVSYLMFLEKQLVNLETFIRKLPTLDPAESWTFDPATDTYKSTPVGTVKTAKVRASHIAYPATDRHPAQVETYTEDVPVGTWSTVKFSGALPASRVNKLLNRVTTLVQAVKFAKEEANTIPIVEPKPGRRVFEYLFAADDE